MALFRRFFYRKPPDRLLEISDRVYVFDCCFSTDALDEDEYKDYMGGIVAQLQDYFPDASFTVFNFKEGDGRTKISDILTEYGMTVMEYPQEFESCPLLPLEVIHHFLRSSESWLSVVGQRNVLLMHCERGGWPVLAFMLASLLLYRKQYNGEQKTLEMVYKQAPRELLYFLSTINPQPSQLRYLQYISMRNLGFRWPPSDTPLHLDCLILRDLPLFDDGKGCRPFVRVYGQDPSSTPSNANGSKLLFPIKTEKYVRHYQQAECLLVKLDIHCRVQGDTVLECIHLYDDLIHEGIMFRVMFHTSFVRSNILMLNREELDIPWDAKDNFPKDFKAEVLFLDNDAVIPDITTIDDAEDPNKAGYASPEEFYEVEEIFSNVVDAREGKGEYDSPVVHDNPVDGRNHKTVWKENLDPYTFQDCSSNDGIHKQDGRTDYVIQAIKDIVVDDVKYKADGSLDSDPYAVKDIVVDDGQIKSTSMVNCTGIMHNVEAKEVTTDLHGQYADAGNKYEEDNQAIEIKLDSKAGQQKNDLSRQKADKLLPPTARKQLLPNSKLIGNTLAGKQKIKLQEQGGQAKIAKPNAITRWIPSSKTYYANSMHVLYPRLNIALANSNSRKEKSADANMKNKQKIRKQRSLDCINRSSSNKLKVHKLATSRSSDRLVEMDTECLLPSIEEACLRLATEALEMNSNQGPAIPLPLPPLLPSFHVKNSSLQVFKSLSLEEDAPPPSPLLLPSSSLAANASIQLLLPATNLSSSSGEYIEMDISHVTSPSCPPPPPPLPSLPSWKTIWGFSSPPHRQEAVYSSIVVDGKGNDGPPFLVVPPLLESETLPSKLSTVQAPPPPPLTSSILKAPSLPPSLLNASHIALLHIPNSCRSLQAPPPPPPPPPPPHSLSKSLLSSRWASYKAFPTPTPPSSPPTLPNLASYTTFSSLPPRHVSNALPPSSPLPASSNAPLPPQPSSPSIPFPTLPLPSSSNVLSPLLKPLKDALPPLSSTPPSPSSSDALLPLLSTLPSPPSNDILPRLTSYKAFTSPLPRQFSNALLLPSQLTLLRVASPSPTPHEAPQQQPPLMLGVSSPLPLSFHKTLLLAPPPPLPLPLLLPLSPSSCKVIPPLTHPILALPDLPPCRDPPLPSQPPPLSIVKDLQPPSPSPNIKSLPTPPSSHNIKSLPVPLPHLSRQVLYPFFPLNKQGLPPPPPPPPPPLSRQGSPLLLPLNKQGTSVPPPPLSKKSLPPPPSSKEGPLPLSLSHNEQVLFIPSLPPPLSEQGCPPPLPPPPPSLSDHGPPSPLLSPSEQGPPPLPPLVKLSPPLPSLGGQSLPPLSPFPSKQGPPPPPPLPPLSGQGYPLPPAPLPLGRQGPPPPPPLPSGPGPPLPPPPLGRQGPPPPPVSKQGPSLPQPSVSGKGPPPPPLPNSRQGPPPPPPPKAQAPGAPTPPGPPRGTPPPPGGGLSGRGRGLSHLSGSTPRRSSLKPLYWGKVSKALQGSLWEELQKCGQTQVAPEFDVSEIETLFSAIVPKTADKSVGRCKSVGSKSDKVHLIELKRANNVEIMLTKIKMPLSEMMAAILTLDDTVLDVDQVESLSKYCPTKEEMELLKGYTGDYENLGRCEQYFLEHMKVPRVEAKLGVFSFKIQFNHQIVEFKKSLNTVNTACEEKILYLGNTLNQGTARGSAVGFKLDSLLKLTETRASSGRMTLMHYLCKVLAEKSPALLDFHLDLVSMEVASKIQLKALAEEMAAINKGLRKVKQELAASENDGPASESFRNTLRDFIEGAELEEASVTALYSAAGKNADDLARYFNEDPARYPFEQVTATLLNFIRLFRKAHEENIKQAELEKKRAEKEAEEKAKAAAASSSSSKEVL
ncbi:formin-like protein 20 isoform X2 [Prosopis cineraria]|uniref:formin-like protein 20 isoform X2 n=1 Tax=Prosopis cineraria TaxID=364024 RepID=UPI00240FD440|nr:formin-like protein 20 isoform X2 [Prosopis cineraria]